MEFILQTYSSIVDVVMNQFRFQPLLYHIFPMIGIFGYCMYPTSLRISPTMLYVTSILHNGALVAFSAWTCVSLSKILYTDGILCQSNYYFQNPEFDKIILYFYISKYYEFVDTFLLYLNGKTPLFLQKYHHIGAVIIWHLFYVYKVDGIWLATLLNSFIHTLMYLYYLCCLLKINSVRFFKQYMTTLQLCQFLILYVKWYVYYPPVESWFNYGIINVFAVYGFGILFLFGEFYYKNYISVKKREN